MTNRGITDESFVRKALDEATSEDGRWVAHQDTINGQDTDALAAKTKAAVVTATSVFVEKYDLEESLIDQALSITTCGDARKHIDSVWPLLK